MSVSVVVAVRNGEPELEGALQSVAAQTRPPDEIVVVDGHSTDRTAEIARSWPGVRHVLQQGTGIGAAYNQGVAEARGELIAFLSHDDRWAPGKLAAQVGYMEAHPEVLYTVTLFRYVLDGEPPPGFQPRLLEEDHAGWIMETLVARRHAFDLAGRFDETMRSAEDVDWFARARDRGLAAAVIPKVLLHKRVSPDGLTLTSGHADLFRALRRSVARKRWEDGTA